MRKLGVGTALLITTLLTAALAGLFYFGEAVLGLPNPAADLSRWLVGAGLGPWINLHSWLGDLLAAAGLNSAQATEIAANILAWSLFLALALLAGLLFYSLTSRRQTLLPDTLDGVTIGLALGIPLTLISWLTGPSAVRQPIGIAWVLGLFLLWGIALSHASRRLMRPLPVVEPEPPEEDRPLVLPVLEPGEDQDAEDEIDAADRMDRRRFLLQLGASTAAITAVSAAAGSALSSSPDERLRPPFPVTRPEVLQAASRLLDNFRRFAIISLDPFDDNAVNIYALGSEYPDRQYVSVWLGDGSPITIYESIETALAAYQDELGAARIVWLDD